MPNTQIIPLKEAVLCLDCSCFTSSKGNTCDFCQSTALMLMAPIFNRRVEIPEDGRGLSEIFVRMEC